MALHSLNSSPDSNPPVSSVAPNPNPAPVLGSWRPFHAQPVEACLQQLGTSLQGLSQAEAEARRKQNEKAGGSQTARPGAKKIFMAGYKKWISLLFIAAASVSFAFGRYVDGLLILVGMLANGGIHGLILWKSLQGHSLERKQEELRYTVRRDSQSRMVQAWELVPGDILEVSGGMVMPADARLVSSYQLQADESLLTGESVLVPKNANVVLHPLEDVTEQANMLFSGTVLKTGKGEAVITNLGGETVMGRIASLASHTEKRESPFIRRLNALSFRIFMMVFVLTALVVGAGYYRGMPLLELVQVALVMGIAAFPETIPGLATLILSMGINRLQDRKVLVKSFEALEGIGDVTILCTDKTGTLTENYLHFSQLFLPELGSVSYDLQWQKGEGIPHRSIEEFLRVGRLNNGTVADGLRSALMGDPIDVALYRAAPASLESGFHVRMNIPFDPVKLRSAAVCETLNGDMVSMIKGAPESVMETCKYYMKPDGTIAEMSLIQRSEFLMFNRKLAYEQNMRVIGFAQKWMSANDDTGPYSDAIFLGWVCLLDPPKPGVVEVIDTLYRMKTAMIMITGDQKATAEITARELGIMRRNADEVWLRSDLEANEQPTIRETVRVFARTKPEEKLAIVESLQRSGHVVAMVGDGVNDSPALQRSDVAISMGLQGSDAAQGSADIILLNDRLEGILEAMKESRMLRRKIHSCIRYLLSCNLGLILFSGASVVLWSSLPVNVVQILWLNLVMGLVPALVLAIEPMPEEVLAEVQPEPEKRESFIKQARREEATKPAQRESLDGEHVFLLSFWAVTMMLAGLGAYYVTLLGLKQPPPVAATAAFCTLAFAQTFNLFNVQALNAGENRRQYLSELSGTPITWVVIAAALLLQALVVYLPGLNALFGTVPLAWQHAPIPLAFGLGAILFTLKTMKI